MADPNTIALGVRPPEVGGGANVNPFAAGLDIMRMQQLANENRQFQLRQQAFQGAAEIMSRHPNDEEGGLRELLASPYGPYAVEFAGVVRQSHLALAQTAEAQARTGQIGMETAKAGMDITDTGLTNFIKHTAPRLYQGIMSDATDDQLQSIFNGEKARTSATMPDSLKDKWNAGLNGWWTSVSGNAPVADPKDPASMAARRAYLSRNLINGAIGAGLTAEDWKQFVGEPSTIDTGAGYIPGTRQPISMGGGFSPALDVSGKPQIIPKAIPPGIHEPNQIPYDPNTATNQLQLPAIGAPPGTFSTGGGGNATGLQLPPPPQPTQPAAQAPPTAPQAPVPATQSQAPSVAPKSLGTGEPLWDDKTPMTAPSAGVKTVAGAPAKTKGQQDAIDRQNEVFDKDGATEYEAAQRSLGNLDYLDNGLSQLARPNFLKPGAAADLRIDMAKGLNMIGSLTGYGDVINPEDLATAEGIKKASMLLRYSTVRGFFGGQREAAQTIASAGNAVPGMDTTVLGGKLLVEELRAQANRLVDMRRWQTEWRNRNFGDLTGSKEAFDAKFSPDKYSRGVLDKFGMTENGFKSGDDISAAVRNGWIPREMGTKLIHDKFPNWKPPISVTGPGAPTPIPTPQ